MKLILHLPPRLADIKEIADIQEAIEPELTGIERQIIQILKNRNPIYADLEGVQIWEEWLHITPDPNKSLEQRQLDIVAKLGERIPFTIGQLRRILSGIVGEENYTITLYDGEARIDINVDVSERDAGNSIYGLLMRMMPAHVWWSYQKTHSQESFNVIAKVAGRLEHIVETLPEEKTYTDEQNLYLNSVDRVEVVVETKSYSPEHKQDIVATFNNAQYIESIIETRS